MIHGWVQWYSGGAVGKAVQRFYVRVALMRTHADMAGGGAEGAEQGREGGGGVQRSTRK